MNQVMVPQQIGMSYNPTGVSYSPVTTYQVPTQLNTSLQPYGGSVMAPVASVALPALNAVKTAGTLVKAGEAVGVIPQTISGVSSTVGAASYAPSLSGAASAATGVEAAAGSGALTTGLRAAGAYAGAASLGFWGGAKLAEMLGGSPTGGSIGGAAGATVGMTFGPMGAVVGGVGGALFGSMFGNKTPSDMTQAGGVNLNTQTIADRYATQESSTGKKFNSQVAALRDATQQGTQTFTKWLTDNGATVKESPDGKQKDIVLIVGARDGFRLAYQQSDIDRNIRYPEQQLPSYKKFGKDYKAYSNGITDAVLENYNIPPELQAKIEDMKKAGDFNDISMFGKSKATTTTGDLIASTQVDTMIEARKEDTKKTWDNFLQSYNKKLERNKV